MRFVTVEISEMSSFRRGENDRVCTHVTCVFIDVYTCVAVVGPRSHAGDIFF